MKRLYFIRHGESEFNQSTVRETTSNMPLTAKGHQQAKQAGRQAREKGLVFDVVMSSPLPRAHETAKHVSAAVGIPHDRIIIDNRLIERDFGSLEGKKDLVDATNYFLDETAIDPHEGVESLADLQKRASEFLAYLHSLPEETILVVGHGAFGRALRRAIEKEPLNKRGEPFANAKLVRLI